MRLKKTLLNKSLLICIGLSAKTGWADHKIDDFYAMSPAELANISVTIATGTPKLITQSAAVTSIITAEQIKSMGATQLHEVLETVPGMHGSLQRSTYDYNYSVRGIQNATNSQLLFMLNGTRITTPFRGTLMTALEMPTEAIQRVEVIRGPGSALYGADAFAGVINIITKKAADSHGSKVGVRAGDWDSQSAWGQHSAQWAGWDVATSLQYQHTAGDGSRLITDDLQTKADAAFGTQASHTPNAMNTHYETFNGHVAMQRQHWDMSFWAFNSVDAGTRGGGGPTLDPYGATNGEQYLGDVRFSTEDWFEHWQLSAHASYLRADFNAGFKLYPDGSRLPITVSGPDNWIGNINTAFAAGGLTRATTPPSTAMVAFPNGVNSALGRVENIPSIELSSIYQGWQQHRLLLNTAFRYEAITTHERRNYGHGVISATPPAIMDGTLTDITNTEYVYLPNTQRSIWSAVVQDEWQMAKDWQLTAGVRYDNYSDFGDTINPRAALVWDINPQLTNKLLYGRAFRAPSFSELGNQNNPVIVGNKALKPETINTIEWAFDYRPFTALRTALNLYYYEIENLITIPMGTVTFENSGNQNGYGTELEWHWQAAEQWQVMGNYAWQNARNITTNSTVTAVPEHHVYVAVGWHFLPQWQLQPQLNWVGSRTKPLGDNRPLDDYETVDLTLRGKQLMKHFNVAASVRNVFDANNFELGSPSVIRNIPMAGRTFYIELSTDF